MREPGPEPLLEPSDEKTPVNPFLTNLAAAPKPPSAPKKPPAPPAGDSDSRPTARPRRVVKPAQYELRAQPGAESPVIKDAHHEFRRGGFLKPLGFIVLAAILLGGLTWLVQPPPKKEVPFERLYAPPKQEDFAIGTSLPPDRIPEPVLRPTLEDPKPARTETPERPSGIVPQKQFADEFKSKAGKPDKR